MDGLQRIDSGASSDEEQRRERVAMGVDRLRKARAGILR